MKETRFMSFHFRLTLIYINFIITVVVAFAHGNNKQVEVCKTKGCLITAGTIFDNFDESVDPCKNFYQYACNNYITNVLPDPEEVFINLERQRYYEYLAELKVLLDSPKNLSEEESIRKAKDLYFACMNSSMAFVLSNAQGLSENIHSVQLFLEDFGGWPLAEGIFWDKRLFNWLGMNYQLIKHGLWSATIITIDKEATRDSVLIKIMPNNMKMIQEAFSYLTQRSISETITIFEKIVQLLGGHGNKTEEVKEFMNIGTNILQILSQSTENTDVTLVNITYLENLAPNLKWRNFLEEIFKIKITEKDEILIRSTKIFRDIVLFLDTSKIRPIANFMFFCLLVNIFNNKYLTPDVIQYLQYNKLNFPETYEKRESPAEYCLRISYEALPQSVQKMHTKKYFTLRDVYKLQTMEKLVKHTFEKQIVDNELLNEDLKKKISLMMQPENSLDCFSILNEDYYKTLYDPNECLMPNRRDHFANMVSIGELNSNRLLQKIKQKKSLTNGSELFFRWSMDSEVRFYNYPENNQTLMLVPKHLLRGLYYAEDRPWYLNYGFLGFYMGRSLFSFLQNEPDARSLYKTDECLKSQATIKTDEIDTDQILNDENVRDITLDLLGLKLLYKVYRDNVDENEEPILPSLNLTARQLFWLSYGTSLCQAYEPDEPIISSITLGQTRVINALRNIDQFAEDFNCPKNSDMNPDNKCRAP